jgi:hypothetical protein
MTAARKPNRQQCKEPLAMVAYFCVTLMERAGMTHSEITETKPRRAAAVRFRIDWEVLKRVGDLSSDKGGIEARMAARHPC